MFKSFNCVSRVVQYNCWCGGRTLFAPTGFLFSERMIFLKKTIAYCASALFLLSFIVISPLRSAALEAMSIFRVSQANTIRIAVTDIQELLTNVMELPGMEELKQMSEASSMGIIGGADGPTAVHVNGEAVEVIDTYVQRLPGGSTDVDLFGADVYHVDPTHEEEVFAEAGIKILSSVDEFTGFGFKLPKSVSETPELAAKDADKVEFPLDVAEINDALSQFNAIQMLPDSFDGGMVTVDTPPVIAAEYDNFIIGATQMPVFSAQDGIDLNVIKDCVLSSTILPANLVQQLAMIDVYTRDVYLPVITGISREVNINGNTGYVYSASDFGMVMSALSLPQLGSAMDEMVGEMTDEVSSAGITAFVWVDDGVIYAMMGEMPEAELLSIARSVK